MKQPNITQSQAIAIAQSDGLTFYPDLSTNYNFNNPTTTLLPTEWMVKFDLLNASLRGGGPTIFVDCNTGAINNRVLAQ